MITRKIDDFGRIVIPRDIRQQLEIEEGEFLQISISGEKIIIEKQTDDGVTNTSTKEHPNIIQENIGDAKYYLRKSFDLLEKLQEVAAEKQVDNNNKIKDAPIKKEYKETADETIRDIQDYLGKVSELLENLQI